MVPQLVFTIDEVASDYCDSTYADHAPESFHHTPALNPIQDVPFHPTSDLPYPFDPSDNEQVSRGHAFHLMLDHTHCLCTHQVDLFLAELSEDELFGRNLRCRK